MSFSGPPPIRNLPPSRKGSEGGQTPRILAFVFLGTDQTRPHVLNCPSCTITTKRCLLGARVADYTFVLFLSETLLTMVASVVLFGMLRRAHDIYKVSIEIQKLGAFALLALCK